MFVLVPVRFVRCERTLVACSVEQQCFLVAIGLGLIEPFVVLGAIIHTHIGEIIERVDMRAEVALLTRNVKLDSEMEDSCYGNMKCDEFPFDTFGGHIKVSRTTFMSLRVLDRNQCPALGDKVLGNRTDVRLLGD